MAEHRSFSLTASPPAGSTSTATDAEQLSLNWDNEAWTANVHIERERIDYVIRLSPLWQVRQFMLFRDLEQPDLWLGTDGHGRWGELNGAHRPELDGALDVTIAGSPFVHSIPIRRLPLVIGDGGRADRARDRRRDARRSSAGRATTCGSAIDVGGVDDRDVDDEFDVDEHGVPDRHRRRAPTRSCQTRVVTPWVNVVSSSRTAVPMFGSRSANAIAASRKPIGLPVS